MNEDPDEDLELLVKEWTQMATEYGSAKELTSLAYLEGLRYCAKHLQNALDLRKKGAP